MQIIPVIDLKDGIVVHAKQGNRSDYAPIQSTLCGSSDIFNVINAFLELYPFPTLYIADLNAITGQGSHAGLLAEILAEFTEITFWIDGGYPICNDDLLTRKSFIPVLGTESFHNGNVPEIGKFNKNFILSLDHSLKGELGASSLFASQSLWPDNIIIMSLPRVGSGQGPDMDKLSTYRKQFPQYNIIAAGGIRDAEDLRPLGQIGVKQALVATALHNGKIKPDNIANG